ncbi:MAG: hypothetical protein ACR2OH_02255 [Microthrixaceae bacterium]
MSNGNERAPEADPAATSKPAVLAQELTEVAAEITGAAQIAFYVTRGGRVRCHALAPAHLGSPLMAEQSAEDFPWCIPTLQPRRFVLVEQAGDLPLPGGGHVRDLGLRSAVHLPIGAGSVGALHIYWDHLVSTWDDVLGAQLRDFGGFVVSRLDESPPTQSHHRRRRTDT